MKIEQKITDEIKAIESTLLILNEKKKKELETHFAKRDYRLLRFLNKEYSVYKFALQLLESLLKQ